MHDLNERHIDRLKAILWEYRGILPAESERMFEDSELTFGEVAEYIKLLCHDPLKMHIAKYLFADELEEQERKEAYHRRIGKTIIFLQMAKASAKNEAERSRIEEQIKSYQAVIDNREVV